MAEWSTCLLRTRLLPHSMATRIATALATRRKSVVGGLHRAGRHRWIVDDAGLAGGLAADAEFVILDDQNSDPIDGDSVERSIQQLLDLDRVQDPLPDSEDAVEAATNRLN